MLTLASHLALGPEAVVSILTGSALLTLAPEDDQAAERAALCVTLGFMVGLITLAMGLFRLGFVECILSRATNRGFILGVAVVIMIEQLLKLLGIEDTVYDHSAVPIMKLVAVCQNLGRTNWIAAVMGLAGLGFLLLVAWAKRRWPTSKILRFFPSVMALVIMSILVSWAQQLPIPILGEVSGGLVAPRPPVFDSKTTGELINTAVVITLVGFIESIIVTKVYAEKHNYFVSANRELVALGSANFFACFFGAYPAFGSMARTVVRRRDV